MKVSYIKLINGEEIIGTVDYEDVSQIIVTNPLKLEREQQQIGEYVGFASIVPMQLEDSVTFSRTMVLMITEIKSSALATLYSKNIEYIDERVRKSSEMLKKQMEEEIETERRMYH